MKTDKIIEILKAVATHAITSELNPNELDNEGFEIFATRIDSLYSGGVSEEEIEKHYAVIQKKGKYYQSRDYVLGKYKYKWTYNIITAKKILIDNGDADYFAKTTGGKVVDWTISKAAQPEVAHCTQCGYHYDSLLKECPTCKGAKSMNDERIELIKKAMNEAYCSGRNNETSPEFDQLIKSALKEFNNK